MVSGGGPRQSEVVGADLSNYDSITGMIRIREKGNKERTNYLENGAADAMADLVTVSKIVGQEEINTTANYDRRPEEAKKKAQQLRTVPYKRRLSLKNSLSIFWE